ncbi:hypothetical protein HG530_008716 [Fusarium avenaceum]|nr:hypothetical protein HG530_008716 [Fusarium avenaceum]
MVKDRILHSLIFGGFFLTHIFKALLTLHPCRCSAPRINLLDPESIAPGRTSPLLASVVVVSAHIVLLKGWIASACHQKLISFEELAKVVLIDRRDNGIARHGIDSVVQIAIDNTQLMIHDQTSIASTYKAVDTSGQIAFNSEQISFQNSSNIVMSRIRLRLPGSQMAINKADRRIINSKADRYTALVAM